jgi:hypothetical protein
MLEHDTKMMETVAAIAAGMFAVLAPSSSGGKNGNTPRSNAGKVAATSNWKQKGRAEGLR